VLPSDLRFWANEHMTKALIDVLIPVYNASATVEGAVESIQTQTVDALNIIIIDDGSTDESPEILARIARRDPRVHVITKANSGIVEALNTGLALCSCQIIARHDADDLSNPDRFATQFAYLSEHPDCVAVSGAARHIDENGLALGTYARFPYPERADPTWIPAREPYLLHPFLMVRRSAMVKLGGYRYAYHAEDSDLCWRLQELGRLYSTDKVMGDYRFHPHSITSRSVVNGRIGALSSQLGAIAAVRRRTGCGDLRFHRDALCKLTAAHSASNMFDAVRQDLSDDEAEYLKAAFAAKLLELSTYRPYELDRNDCRFVRGAFKSAEARIHADNLMELRQTRSVVSARLLRKGRFESASLLLGPDTLVQTGCRLGVAMFARTLPMSTRRSIRSFRSKRMMLRPE
jgi:glycosyltransferase involved in cell wall biosynthesis